MSKSWKEECGVMAIWNHPDASRLTYLGLYAQQHRGQEAAGIVTLEGTGGHLHHKGLGLVGDVFSETDLERLVGNAAIGHVRYSTTGQNVLTNTQPLTAALRLGPAAIAHNGNIVNSDELRRELIEAGAIFQGTNDTECLVHLLARHRSSTVLGALQEVLPRLDGAYSLVMLTRDRLIAARDPYGFRPLVLGELAGPQGKVYLFASETCAFDLLGAKLVREVEPGEIVSVGKDNQIESFFLPESANQKRHASCVFEHVYFSRPDSVVFGQSVYNSRKLFGKMLAKESFVDADMVLPVPDSGVPAAIGYSQESGIPFELGIIRNHYIGRTFIQPHQSIRDFGVKIKLNPQSEVLKGQRVIVIDDSLVRGTTSKKVIHLIRQAGAAEVHVRIAAPPTKGPCLYGVDTPQKTELIASHQSTEQIRQFIGADSLSYLSMEGMFAALNGQQQRYCAACFTGEYPTSLYNHKL